MKKLFLGLVLLFLCEVVNAQAIMEDGPWYHDAQGYYGECLKYSPWCPPHKRMWNRSHTKIIAEYQPSWPKIYTWVDNTVWRMGNAQTGLTAIDYADINDAKVKSGGYYRWGICWPGAHPATICLE